MPQHHSAFIHLFFSHLILLQLSFFLPELPFQNSSFLSPLSHTLGSNGNDPTKLPRFPQQAAPSFSEPEALCPLQLRHRSLGTAYRCISFATLEHPVTYLHVPYLRFNTFLTRHLQMSIELLFGDIRAVRILGHVGMLTLVLSRLNHLQFNRTNMDSAKWIVITQSKLRKPVLSFVCEVCFHPTRKACALNCFSSSGG